MCLPILAMCQRALSWPFQLFINQFLSLCNHFQQWWTTTGGGSPMVNSYCRSKRFLLLLFSTLVNVVSNTSTSIQQWHQLFWSQRLHAAFHHYSALKRVKTNEPNIGQWEGITTTLYDEQGQWEGIMAILTNSNDDRAKLVHKGDCVPSSF